MVGGENGLMERWMGLGTDSGTDGETEGGADTLRIRCISLVGLPVPKNLTPDLNRNAHRLIYIL